MYYISVLVTLEVLNTTVDEGGTVFTCINVLAGTNVSGSLVRLITTSNVDIIPITQRGKHSFLHPYTTSIQQYTTDIYSKHTTNIQQIYNKYTVNIQEIYN